MICSYTRIKISKFIDKFLKFRNNFPNDVPNKVNIIVERKFSYISSKKKSWNVLFFGSDNFSLECLKNLHEKYRSNKLINHLEVVTTSTNKNNVIWKFTKQHGLQVQEWPPCISNNNFHIGVVVSFGRLIPSYIIDLFPLGMINVHASLLPRWRGAAPIIHALKNGDTVTGISLMKIMPKKFDIGDVLMQEEINIHPDETLPELHERLAQKAGEVLIKAFEQIPEILDLAKPQNSNEATYAPKVTPIISFIKWNEMTAKNIYNLQRAIFGLFPLRTKFNNKIVKLLDVGIVTKWWNIKAPRSKIPGLVFYSEEYDLLFVNCLDDSWISVEKIILPGKTAMSAANFNNGFIRNRRIKKILE